MSSIRRDFELLLDFIRNEVSGDDSEWHWTGENWRCGGESSSYHYAIMTKYCRDKRTSKIARFLRKSLEKHTWKTIVVVTIVGYFLRYIFVLSWCFFCHLLFYQWTSCLSDKFYPKSFSHVSTSVLRSASACSGAENVLVYVPSSFSDFGRRQLIRDTWAKELFRGNLKAKFVFILGSAGGQTHNDQVQHELTQFDDLIHFDIIDHYYNLTLKTRAVFNWTLHNCPSVEFLIRADDDIVLHAENLYRFLAYHRLSRRPVVFGLCRNYDCITRVPSSKSCLPRDFYRSVGKIFYPSYCLGFSSVVSMEYLRRAANLWSHNSNVINDYLPMEDLHAIGFTGDAIEAWKIGHPKLFTPDRHFDTYSCHASVLASAAYKSNELMAIKWKTYHERCMTK